MIKIQAVPSRLTIRLQPGIRSRVRGPEGSVIPARRTICPPPCGPADGVDGQEGRCFAALADGQAGRPDGARRERDGDDPAARQSGG